MWQYLLYRFPKYLLWNVTIPSLRVTIPAVQISYIPAVEFDNTYCTVWQYLLYRFPEYFL
jgi:hypothetical protein